MSSNDDKVVTDYHPPATWSSDYKVLKSMIFADVHGNTQQERLESFYVSQADLYDSYRHRMLHGRFPMINAMPAPRGGIWVDMGGGTGSNLEYFGNDLNRWSKVVVLDLCPSLVDVATKRVNSKGWSNFVDVVLGDACDFECPGLPATGTVDVVSFSYALTMIPDWKKAIKNAFRMLKPGGHIAVCDFTVTESQSYGMSAFWTWLFAHDHVHLKKEHIATLGYVFETKHLEVGFGEFPYVPSLLKCPYYSFVGQKVNNDCPL
uniref:Methyltransferase type 11 domain-containing protein n=1 Tax=Chromulina nebulosa TaxID=96789 RepID=A0A6T5VPN0_9STRA|mmetsp:Transcript_390/g.340  ORF Transcript_390/g.340 Transcript_390/m.340 type:complete len:262 (+) Transcript_390:77-862(+)